MPFNKDRNSRDDKSKKDSKKPFKKNSSGKFTPYGSSESDKKKKSYRRNEDSENSKRPYKSERGEYSNNGKYGNEKVNFRERKEWQAERQDRDSKKRPHTDENISDRQVKLRSRKSVSTNPKKETELVRLNRYIANAGICSRRKADELIVAGTITVNGVVVSELGAKVNPAVDKVKYNGELLKREKVVYVLLNKPKDFITTTDDPQERKTVMELVKTATNERIYPVGRLDRNTTGLLLMTNDGDLAEKLSHPRNNITKIYNVELNKSLTQGDFNKIAFGVELEDGFIKPDAVSYVTGGSKREVGIQIHSGKNRIVRRIFESLGYEVTKLDRVIYANLTKKDLPRGKWRFLTEHEVIQLKHFIK